MERRVFIKNTSIGAAALGLPYTLSGAIRPPIKKDPFTGIQIGAHSILDEGIEYCLDTLQEKGEINALVLYSHTYYGAENRPVNVFHDHGKGVKDISVRKLPRVWVKHHDSYFKNLKVGHQTIDDSFEYHDRDIFQELRSPMDKRGMKLYIRLLEAGAHHGLMYIPGYERLMTVDVHGGQGSGPCWNHPEYRQWMLATLKDIFDHYDIDGIQYGAERVGLLSEVLLKGRAPACFCEHCLARNRALGIDVERSKQGYLEMEKLMNQVRAGNIPPDGVMISIWSVLQRYHEVLAWNYQWYRADEEIQKMLYNEIKEWKPEAWVGRHIDHQRSSWDPFYRSAVGYDEMAEYADFIKPILYHDIYGPRLRNWVIAPWKELMFADFTEEQVLEYYYAVFQLDPTKEPSLDALNNEGLSPDYVAREVRRCVEGVNGKADVISGIGIDVPWHLPEGGMGLFLSDPEVLYQATMQSFKAGASGVLASRDYDEMRLSSLEVFGNAVRDWKRGV